MTPRPVAARDIFGRDIVCPRCEGKGEIRIFDGMRARAERKAVGMSLREAARRLKISAAYLSDLELARRQPGEALRPKIADLYFRSRR